MNKSIMVFVLFGFLSLVSLMYAPHSLYSLPSESKETLRIGISNFPASLHPFYAVDETSQGLLNKVFDSLYYFDGSGRLQDGLVENDCWGDNDNEIILTLKRGIFFANNHELEADDVIATLQRIKDPGFQSPYITKLDFINRVEKVGKYSLKLVLNYPLSPWKSYLCIKILDAGEMAATNPATFRDTILSGTGAYRIREVHEPAKIILSLNDAAKNPSLYRSLEYVVISYTQLAPLKLINHEIDICELQPDHKDGYNNIKRWQQEFTILEYKKFGYTYLVFNLKNIKLNRDVRRIFYNLLINGDFVDRFLNGKGERVVTPFLLLNNKVKPGKFLLQPLEKPLQLKILGNSESKLRKEFILFLREELQKYNIHLEPLFLEYHTFLDYIKKAAFDMAVSGYMLDIDYDMKDIFYSSSYFNYAHFTHPEMDRLLDKGLLEKDPAKREAIYLQAHDIWLEELPLIPLFNLYYYVGVSRQVKVPGTVSTLVGSESDFLIDIRQWIR
ncbi:MAG TPA: ABC transporter substrate-binding protein [Candidatus Deferrimicrobium sp.]|nr:ABC transporter substrate-binding protein [Candidatus Deferrimicrobium sp.]